MRTISFVLLLGLFQVLAAPIMAGTIRGDDYPVQYEVLSNGQNGKSTGAKSCSMVLRDESQTKVAINVSRRGMGACHVLDSGKVYRGRVNDKKNELELVILVGADKARVENWQIDGTVDLKPQ